jgi:hypothetical protein
MAGDVMIELSQIGVALLDTVLGLFVLHARPRNAVNHAFAAQSLAFAGWVLGVAGFQNPNNLDLSFGFAFGFASLIPVAFLLFAYCYPSATSWSSPLYVRIIFAIGILFMSLSLMTDLIVHSAEVTPAGLSRKAGPLYSAFAVYFITTWCVGVVIFASKWRSSRGLARAQFHYLGAGIIGGSLGGIFTNLLVPLLTGDSRYSWIGPYFSLVYVGFIAHAIIRLRLMDLRLFIHRGLTITIAIVLSTMPAALLVAAFWPRLLMDLDGVELVLFLTAVGAVTLLTPITRDAASRLLDRYVYRTQANYQRTVREASEMLTRVLHLEVLLRFISATVVRSTAAEGVVVYLRENDEFRLAIAELGPGDARFDTPTRAPAEVVAALRSKQEPVLADEVARDRDVIAVALHGRLAQANWSLLLPVVSEETLIAIIACGRSKVVG